MSFARWRAPPDALNGARSTVCGSTAGRAWSRRELWVRKWAAGLVAMGPVRALVGPGDALVVAQAGGVADRVGAHLPAVAVRADEGLPHPATLVTSGGHSEPLSSRESPATPTPTTGVPPRKDPRSDDDRGSSSGARAVGPAGGSSSCRGAVREFARTPGISSGTGEEGRVRSKVSAGAGCARRRVPVGRTTSRRSRLWNGAHPPCPAAGAGSWGTCRGPRRGCAVSS